MTSKIITKEKTKTKAHSQDSIPSFIRKTYDILEERKFPEVIDWNPEGTALVIKKPSEFCQKVLPTYFKHNNLTSFVRQLNMYNFHKRRTQNIDHVYYHELFQRGKKHLLKEIKRKNHEHNADKTPKGPEMLDSAQGNQDVSSLMYENQILKRLYNDAMTKVNMFETQIKELTMQNQSLWSQICQKNDQLTIQKPFPELTETKNELTQEQLPMTLGEIYIPPLKLNNEQHMAIEVPMAKNISSYLNLNAEDSGESTEASHNSPSLQPNMESDKGFDMTEPTPSTYPQEVLNESMQLPILTLTPQVSNIPQLQTVKPSEGLFATRQDLSIGTLFAVWNNEVGQNTSEGLGFGEAKVDKAYIDTQSIFHDNSVLGKRQLEQVNTESQLHANEPLGKRCELSVFSKKGLISTGMEEKELFRMMKRDSEVDGNYDMGVDLMDFNPVFTSWTKAT